jgi:hypothetical protein
LANRASIPGSHQLHSNVTRFFSERCNLSLLPVTYLTYSFSEIPSERIYASMNKQNFRLSMFSALLVFSLSPLIHAQGFQRSFQPGAGARISVRNVSGNVDVTGYDGNSVIIIGRKEGRDRGRVQIEDHSSGASVDISVHYPDRCNCDASVQFEVRVPRSISFRFDKFSSVSGDVHLRDLTGDLNASSVSGDVTARNLKGHVQAHSVSGDVEIENISGTVSTSSTSGDVNVSLTRLEGSDHMTFTSVSGNVRVQMPGDLNAQVEMSVLSGSLKTDFPLQIHSKEYGPGQKASGMVGDGGARRLKMSSTSGNVSLLR